MNPLEAKFNGAEGICLGQPHMKDGGIYRLKRDRRSPLDFPKMSFKNQLIWHYPDGQDPKLLFCNRDGEWFNLSFSPIDLESL